MLKLDSLFSLQLLEEHISNKLVSRRYHDTYPLAILNYTQECVFERKWDSVTLACRGLIYNIDTLEVLSRPFEKFFNLDEPNCLVNLDTDEIYSIWEKLDGSLIILYNYNGWNCATRGSFNSVQAETAQSFVYDYSMLRLDKTYLFELICPNNRMETKLVVDYGDKQELRLLAVIDTDSGEDDWQEFSRVCNFFPCCQMFSRSQMDEILFDGKDNFEGFVLVTSSGRCKIKLEEYKRKQRLLNYVTKKRVFQDLVDGREPNKDVPEEFRNLVEEWEREILHHYMEIYTNALEIFQEMPKGDRKLFALHVKKQDRQIQPILFNFYDNKNPARIIWRNVESKI